MNLERHSFNNEYTVQLSQDQLQDAILYKLRQVGHVPGHNTIVLEKISVKEGLYNITYKVDNSEEEKKHSDHTVH